MAYTVTDRGVQRPLSDVLAEMTPEQRREYKEDIRAVLEANGQKVGPDYDALFGEVSAPAAVAPAPAPASPAPSSGGLWDAMKQSVRSAPVAPTPFAEGMKGGFWDKLEALSTPVVDRSETFRKAQGAYNEGINSTVEGLSREAASVEGLSPYARARLMEMKARGESVDPTVTNAIQYGTGSAISGAPAALAGTAAHLAVEGPKQLFTSPLDIATAGIGKLGGLFKGARTAAKAVDAGRPMGQGEAILARTGRFDPRSPIPEDPNVVSQAQEVLEDATHAGPAGFSSEKEAIDAFNKKALIEAQSRASTPSTSPSPAASVGPFSDDPAVEASRRMKARAEANAAREGRPLDAEDMFDINNPGPIGAKKKSAEIPRGPAGSSPKPAPGVSAKVSPDDLSVLDDALKGKFEMPKKPAQGLRAFLQHPVDAVRKIANWAEDQIDSSAKVLRSKVDPHKSPQLAWLHRQLRTHSSRVKDSFKHDASFVYDALKPLKSAEETRLFNVVYSLKHFAHQYKARSLNYGPDVGANAEALLAELRNRLMAAGKGDQLARVEMAVEDFAGRVDDVGFKSVEGFVDEATFRDWQKKNRYYMFARTKDYPLAGASDDIPDADEVFTRYLKRRKSFSGMPVMDPIELFSEYHYKRLLAQDKRKLTEEAVRRLGKIFDNAGELEKSLAKSPGDVRYEAPRAYEVGKHISLPREIVEVFRGGDKMTSGIFYQAAKDASSVFHVGALDLNPRFYGSSFKRDLFDTGLRSRGYLTPVDKFLGEKVWNPAVKKLGMPGLAEEAPDLEPLLNPALWYRAAVAAVKENWGKGDALATQLRATGAIQMPDAKTLTKEAMPSHLLSKGQRLAKAYVAPKLMKTMDDFWRFGQALRAIDDPARGIKGMKNMLSAGKDGSEVAFKNFDEHVLNVRGTNIDFEMKSDFLRRLDVMSPFLSAMIQSPYQTWQFAKAQPFSMALRTAGFMSAATASYTHLKGRPDSPLDRFSDHDKDRYIFADTGLRRGNRPIFAPVGVVPEPLQPLWEALRRQIDIGSAKDPEFKKGLEKAFLSETASAALGSYVNLGGPIIASIEAPLNRSLYKGGKSITLDRQRYDPVELQASESTQNVYRLMGNLTKKLPFAMSPDQYKHLARGFTGQVSEWAADAVDPLLKNAVPVPHVDVASGKFPFPVGDASVLKREKAPPLEKVTTALGFTRRGNSDPDRDLAAATVGRIQQQEKALVAELKHWYSIILLSKDEAQLAEARERLGDTVRRMSTELGPYGGVPAIKEILKNVAKDIMYENNVPHGKVLQHMPDRYKGVFFRALAADRPNKLGEQH